MTAIALTLGEPAGIGPDVFLQLVQTHSFDDIVVIADVDLLKKRAKQLNLDFALKPQCIQHVPMQKPCQPGMPLIDNAEYILKTLDIAIAGCQTNQFSALVTGPLQKSIINKAGHDFTGHTEYLAEKTNTMKTVMCFENKDIRMALVTTHLPLKKVPETITKALIKETIKLVHSELQTKFSIKEPVIGVCGLNPHAGESGYLGLEEIERIEPAMKELNQCNIHCKGPYPADTIFQQGIFDCIISMYHDQLLPMIKYHDFLNTVNITLGLPFVRTSVDHGTALDLAGTGKANPQNLLAAINAARRLL